MMTAVTHPTLPLHFDKGLFQRNLWNRIVSAKTRNCRPQCTSQPSAAKRSNIEKKRASASLKRSSLYLVKFDEGLEAKAEGATAENKRCEFLLPQQQQSSEVIFASTNLSSRLLGIVDPETKCNPWQKIRQSASTESPSQKPPRSFTARTILSPGSCTQELGNINTNGFGRTDNERILMEKRNNAFCLSIYAESLTTQNV